MGAPEAAEYLGVQLRTLYKFIDESLIPAYKLGRVIRLKREGFGERRCRDRGWLRAPPHRPPSPGRFTGPPLRDTAPVMRLEEHRRPLKVPSAGLPAGLRPGPAERA